MAGALPYLDLIDQTRIFDFRSDSSLSRYYDSWPPLLIDAFQVVTRWLWCPTDHPQFPAKTCSSRDEEQFPIDLGEIRRTRVPSRNYILDQYGACRSAITLP